MARTRQQAKERWAARLGGIGLAFLVLLPLGASLALAAGPSALQADGEGCPTRAAEEPCDPGCPCACCPGHGPAAILPEASASPRSCGPGRAHVVFADDAHARETVGRIFHPPRSL